MKVTIINGSPKQGISTSKQIIDYLVSLLQGKDIEVQQYVTNRKKMAEPFFSDAKTSDALLIVFPLYIDSIPAHLLRILGELEKMEFKQKSVKVYSIVNNGFYEGKQNQIALAQLKSWCRATTLSWGQGIGVGAGEMLPFLKEVPLGYGPNKNLGKALNDLTNNLLALLSAPDIYISPNWPRFLWKLQSSLLVWYPRAKKNNLKKAQLYSKQQ